MKVRKIYSKFPTPKFPSNFRRLHLTLQKFLSHFTRTIEPRVERVRVYIELKKKK